MLTKRQLSILKMILRQPGVHGKNLSESLGVTSRTIRSEIAEINHVAKVILISSNPQKGYVIEQEYFAVAQRLLTDDCTSLNENDSRMHKILANVLFSDECYLYELSEILGLSESATRKEIVKTLNILETRFGSVVFELKKDKCMVHSSEEEVRKLLFQIAKYEISNDTDGLLHVLNILLDGCSILNSFDQEKQTIQSILFSASIDLNEMDLMLLTTCIEITRVRNLFGYSIDQEICFQADSTFEKFMGIYAQICLDISYLNKNDAVVLYPLFHTFKYNYQTEQTKISDFSRVVYSGFCSEVFDKYAIDLRESDQLSENILLHLEFMIRRILGGYELKNPILDEVKKKYPYAFEIGMMIVPIIFKYKKIYISEDEVSYLAIYVAHFLENVNQKLKTLVITSQRHSVKNIVVKWLKDYFQNQIEVVEVVNNYEVKKRDLASFDLAIFLNDFTILPKLETYSIIGLPDLKDLEGLNKVIYTVRLNKRVSHILEEYIEPDCVHMYDHVISLKELLLDLSNSLYQRDILDDANQFYEDLIMREKNYPTNVGNKIMLPHTLFTFAKKTGIEVALLKKPLEYNQSDVQILFVLALEKGQKDNMSTLFSFFNQMAAHPKYVDNLISSKCREKFIENLHDFKLLE